MTNVAPKRLVHYHNWRWLWVSALIVTLDQATKMLAAAYLNPYRPLVLLPFWDLVLLYNNGAAFGILQNATGWQKYLLPMVSVVIIIALLRWLSELAADKVVLAISFTLIIGGGLGNLLDRITTGYVVDFISLHYAGWYWPAFNIADSAITVGVALMLVDIIFFSNRADE